MNLLLLALLLSQTAGYGYCSTGYVVQSIPRNGPLICVPNGSGGAVPGGSSGNLQTNNGSGGFGAYAGSSCTAPNFVRVIDASGAVTCAAPTLRLDQLSNPSGDTTFTYPSGTKMLWTFTGSTDNAFSIHGDGAFTGTGDLVHIHKSGTGSSTGADALHVEVDSDTNMTGVRITMPNSTRDALTTNAKITASGGFVGDLTGNATTASSVTGASAVLAITPPTPGGACTPHDKAVIDTNGKWWTCDTGTWFSTAWGQVEQALHLAANGANCSTGQVPLGVDTYGNAEGCYTGPADVVAVPIVTTAATSVLSNEQVLPTCTSGDVLTFNGTAISCTTPGAGPSGPARTTTTGAYSNTSNTVWSTVMTISGLSASTRYEIHCNLRGYADATTTGIRLRLNSSGTMTSMAVKFEKCSSTTAVRTVTVTALTTSTADTASAGTTICLDTIDGFFTTNTATDLRIEGVSEINLSGVYIDVGSSCTVEAY